MYHWIRVLRRRRKHCEHHKRQLKWKHPLDSHRGQRNGCGCRSFVWRLTPYYSILDCWILLKLMKLDTLYTYTLTTLQI
jgi:hypothetical protein